MSFPRAIASVPSSRMGRLWGYVALSRISNAPTVVTNVLAGAAISGAAPTDGRVALLAVAMVLLYTAGMYLNDLCDLRVDRLQRPHRPLPSGAVPLPVAWAITLGLFVAGLSLLWMVAPVAFASGLVLVGLIVAYDLWHKTNPLSPLLMAACRAMVYVVAFVALASRPTLAVAAPALLLALYIVGLTYIAKTESRPALTGYWPFVLLILPAAYWTTQLHPLVAPLLVGYTAWVVYSASFIYRPARRDIGGAVGRLIAGVSLLDSLVIAASGHLAGAVLALAAFGLTLVLQRYVKGT